LRPRRRFDQRPQEPTTRINEAIRVPQVRLIDADGSQIGIKSTEDAQRYAWDKNLDLVEVAPDAKPPVCRVMDYSKYKYEQEQKAKLARKHQSTITIKEIKLRPKIDPHDYATKKGHVVRFLKNRDKVKVTIMFRGREMTHPERGRALLLKMAEEVAELGVIESNPLQDGRNMVMMLAPHKAPAKEAEAPAETAAPAATPEDPAAVTDTPPAAEPEAEKPEREAETEKPAAAAKKAPAKAPAAKKTAAPSEEQPEAPEAAPATKQPAKAPAKAAAAKAPAKKT
jgi:translation initiation factor IF-3